MKNIVLLNQAVVGTVNAGRSAFDAAVRDLGDFARAWPNATRSIVTHRHPMADFCRIAGGGDGIKHVIDVAGAG
jgi:glucose 1-dehydrogenase